MTHLLGRQDCVDSLRRDLTDIQGAVLDVLSCTGPVRFPSWKFPDKMSCNLDLASLLEHYDFVEGEEEFNQHSHVVLLELMIDRLMLLLQSSNAHAEVILGVRRSGSQRHSVSLGLVVRRYWQNLLQLSCLHLKEGQTNKCEKEESPVEGVGEQLKSECELKSTFIQRQESSVCQRGYTYCPESASRDMCSVGCQTVASSPLPCHACSHMQHSLRVTSDTLSSICQRLGLPSCLSSFLEEVHSSLEPGQLSVPDMAQWAAQQSRDLGRLGKYLAQLQDTIHPLKDSLATLEGERGKLKIQLEQAERSLAQQSEEHQASLENIEVKLQKVQAKGDEAKSRLQGDLEEMRLENLSLKERNSKLKAELCNCSLQLDKMHSAAHERDRLQWEVQAKQEKLEELKEQIHTLQTQLAGQQLLLDKESAKYESACRQQEATQAKQRALLERVDALDRECVDLQGRLGQMEESRAELQGKLRSTGEEKELLQAQLSQQQVLGVQLQEEAQALRVCVKQLRGELEEQRQRERLLVAYPELCPPTQGSPQSTGDVLGDMEQQLRSNMLRIGVLEQENATLSASLAQLREKGQHGDCRVTGDSPYQLRPHCPAKTPEESQGRWHPSPEGFSFHPQGGVSQQGAGLRDGIHALERGPMFTVLHCQAVELLLPAEEQAAESCSRIRAAAQTHCAAPRRKQN
ncbi:coiled-coil domain-containing protein 157 [Brienomyrus brachyistius]|uniref:coiled-coil domain-containing protein 157 n=1 Tax=Brienomyrus brachyistius TaxID=42636 RepID=UPI0020B3693F|nr:coiled-coil domain-containing protein 157 [Brienomyrus brachyistius]